MVLEQTSSRIYNQFQELAAMENLEFAHIDLSYQLFHVKL